MKHLPFTPHGKVKNVLESDPDDLVQALANAMMEYAREYNRQPNSFQHLLNSYSALLKENSRLYMRIAELRGRGASDELIQDLQKLRAHLRNIDQFSVSDRIRDMLAEHGVKVQDAKLTD